MRSQALSAAVQKIERIIRVLRWLYLAAVPAYFVFIVAKVGWPLHQSLVSSNPMAGPLTVTAVLAAIVGKIIGRLALPGGVLWRFSETRGDTGVMKSSTEVDQTVVLSSEDRRLALAAPTAFIVFTVEIACYEAIALFGVVLAFVAHNPMGAVPFGLAAIVLMWTVPPNLDRFFEAAAGTATT